MSITPFTGFSYATGLAALGQGLGRVNEGIERAEERRLLENLGRNMTPEAAAAAGKPELALKLKEMQLDEQRSNNALRILGGGAPATAGGSAPASPQSGSGGFPASLIGTESGGRWDAQNGVVGAGGQTGHFGRLQFGKARLQEAAAAGAIPEGTTPEQFMRSPEMQQAAERWHFGNIDQFITTQGLDRAIGKTINGVPITLDGMRAVAHLGGNGGLLKFVTSGGAYNPSDANGTSLLDYLGKHQGSTQGPAPAEAQPSPVRVASAGPVPVPTRQNPVLSPQNPSMTRAQIDEEVRRTEAETGRPLPDTRPGAPAPGGMPLPPSRPPQTALDAPPAPESPMVAANSADLPAQGATPVQASGFRVPGAGGAAPTTVGVETPEMRAIKDRVARLRQAAAVGPVRDRPTYLQEASQLETEYRQRQNQQEQNAREAQKETARIERERRRSLTDPAERAQYGVDPNYKGTVQVDGNGTLTYPGKASTEVNLSQQTEKAYDQDIAKQQAKRFGETQETGRSADKQINTLRVMEKLIDHPHFYSGTGGERALNFRRAAESLGIADAGTAAPTELFAKLARQSVVDKLGGSLGSGVSNSDVSFISGITANLDNSREGNRAVIQLGVALAQREKEVAKVARDYAKNNGGRLDAAFEDHLSEWAEKNPLKLDEIKLMAEQKGWTRRAGQAPPSNGQPQPQPREEPRQARRVGPPTAGAVEDGYRFKGGNPADPASWERVQ